MASSDKSRFCDEDARNALLIFAGIIVFTVLIYVSRSYGYGYSYPATAGSFSIPKIAGNRLPGNNPSEIASNMQNQSAAVSDGDLNSAKKNQTREESSMIDDGNRTDAAFLSGTETSIVKPQSIAQQENYSPVPAPAPSPASAFISFDDRKGEAPQAEAGINVTKLVNVSHAAAPQNEADLFIPNEKEEWLVTLNRQLQSAKEEIEAAPLANDPEFYSPLYYNVSRFKRSYELMEKIFKVYIYAEGKIPYFHSGPMTGIYASEGWFMKQMEESKQFVTDDYKKAHAFYIPYSVAKLRQGIPAPEHHNMPQISLFIKDYISLIASKHPFWNRTHGKDHFFVACHDWGGYTTKKQPDLKLNAIKIICNSDTSDGFFIASHDGSLPETFVHDLKQPPTDLGGLPPERRDIFAFFAGQTHGRVRPVLFKYWRDKDPDMLIYGNLPKSISRTKSYKQHMKESKFCICPMGYEVNSPRMVEAIYYGCVPVIIADNFFLPFSEVINWDSFSLTVPENEVPNLKKILLNISESDYLTKQSRLSKVRKHFLWHRGSPKKYDIFHMILHSVWTNRLKNLDI